MCMPIIGNKMYVKEPDMMKPTSEAREFDNRQVL